MIQDLIVIKNKLSILYEEMTAAFEHYGNEIDGIGGEQDEFFIVEVSQLHLEMYALMDRMQDTITSFIIPLEYHKRVIGKAIVKPFNLSDFINHQKELMKLVEQTLHIPLHYDSFLVQGLKELVYTFGWGRTSGIPIKARPRLRFLMMAVAGWMLIKKYGGEFIKMDGLCVRIEDLNCIIMLEANSNNERFYEWFESVDGHLSELQNGIAIPKSFKGISQY